MRIFELKAALSEIERVGESRNITVESDHDEQGVFNVACWALTAQAFFDTGEWIWLFFHFGYTGDCEFIYCE